VLGRTPYSRVLRLVGWARSEWSEVNGRCYLSGLGDLRSLELGVGLDILHALFLDRYRYLIADGDEFRERVRVYLDTPLDETEATEYRQEIEREKYRKAQAERDAELQRLRDTWGMDSEAFAVEDALTGGAVAQPLDQ
jgi:hypothetical protein